MNTLTLKRALLALRATLLALPGLVLAQDTIEWFTLGNDYAHTRYTPAAEITADNFSDLDVAWEWDGASYCRGGRCGSTGGVTILGTSPMVGVSAPYSLIAPPTSAERCSS